MLARLTENVQKKVKKKGKEKCVDKMNYHFMIWVRGK